ncbi:hypothetical protein BJ912DRAFT_920626 [Pholiota molesta]|nr:hypothetical protein BJ912DRAFT_920626 [Pholiota molesta]
MCIHYPPASRGRRSGRDTRHRLEAGFGSIPLWEFRLMDQASGFDDAHMKAMVDSSIDTSVVGDQLVMIWNQDRRRLLNLNIYQRFLQIKAIFITKDYTASTPLRITGISKSMGCGESKVPYDMEASKCRSVRSLPTCNAVKCEIVLYAEPATQRRSPLDSARFSRRRRRRKTRCVHTGIEVTFVASSAGEKTGLQPLFRYHWASSIIGQNSLARELFESSNVT